MGGERASTARARLEGRICCNCKRSLDPPYTGRERWCTACRPPRHRVYMLFFLRDGWKVQFSEADLKTPLPAELTFQSAAKIREMYDRVGADKKLEDRNALEHAIENGRGGIWLHLTTEQYARLKRGR